MSKKRKITAWHKLNCKQITDYNPTCRCMQVNHHVDAYHVAKFLGMTT